MRRSVIVAIGFAVALVGVIALKPAVSPEPGERANLDFTLKDMNGRDVRLADYAGKPLILNFWATWCRPCLVEIPDLIVLSEKYKDRGLTILGISTDDDPESLQRFASELHIPYPLLQGLGREEVGEAFGLGLGIPMSVFIKADGTISGRLEGISTRAWWEKQIQALF